MSGSNVDKLKAVIIGLGQVGSRFDEQEGRQTVWSHVGSYLALADRYEIVGACDIDEQNVAAFKKRCPDVPVFSSIPDMLGSVTPDVVSIATPTETHMTALNQTLECSSVKVVWCEKPLAGSIDEGAQMVQSCHENKVSLLVSYVRRWTPFWQQVRHMMDDGQLGRVHCIRIAMPNRLVTVGSHAIDLMLYLGGAGHVVGNSEVVHLAEKGEPAKAALINFETGAYGILQVTGPMDRLMVEGEIIGDNGRIFCREDTGLIRFEPFVESTRYANYQQLGPALENTFDTLSDMSPFVAMAAEIVDISSGSSSKVTCDGNSALRTQDILETLLANHSDV